MPLLATLRGDSLERATAQYEETLSLAAEFLLARGIGSTVAKRFRLGYVQTPASGHETFVGRLSIPYVTRAGVVSLRFRRLDDGDAKYLQSAGTGSWLYNVSDLYRSPSLLVLCEGELDAITCSGYVGIPAVAVAGVNAWKPAFAKCFESAAVVLVAGDGDEAGSGMVERLCDVLPNARPAQMPSGLDLNSMYLAEGAEAVEDYLISRL